MKDHAKTRSNNLYRLVRPLPTLLAISILLTLILNVIVFLYQFSIVPGLPSPGSYTYIGDDKTRELPIKVRTVNMVFHDDPEHYRLTGMQAWADWNAIRPPGSGFAFLGEAYLPYDVSMWHQLHCLNHIRTILINGDDGSDHTEHCFHYLRQGILCAADITLEPGGPDVPGDHVVPGIGTTHTCRDWKQVYDWLEEEHSKWTPEQLARMKESSDGTHGAVHQDFGHPT